MGCRIRADEKTDEAGSSDFWQVSLMRRLGLRLTYELVGDGVAQICSPASSKSIIANLRGSSHFIPQSSSFPKSPPHLPLFGIPSCHRGLGPSRCVSQNPSPGPWGVRESVWRVPESPSSLHFRLQMRTTTHHCAGTNSKESIAISRSTLCIPTHSDLGSAGRSQSLDVDRPNDDVELTRS